MSVIRALVGASMISISLLAHASAFFDPVRFEAVLESDAAHVVFSISPPSFFAGHEVSWPAFCWSVLLVVPRDSQLSFISSDEHQAALLLLQEAAKVRAAVTFGSGGHGLIRAKGDRCTLSSKALRIETDVGGRVAVISFNED